MAESAKKFAKEIMKTDVVKVGPEVPVKEVAKMMLQYDISGFPVVDEQGNVLGVVTELDLMRNQIAPNEPSIWTTIWGMDAERMNKYNDARRKYLASTAGEVMTSPALTVDVSDPVDKVANIMFNKQVKRLFVTDGGKLAGVISRSAFTKLMLDIHEG
jgi:CBS domain-containing protein